MAPKPTMSTLAALQRTHRNSKSVPSPSASEALFRDFASDYEHYPQAAGSSVRAEAIRPKRAIGEAGAPCAKPRVSADPQIFAAA
jgi:hypothetical protein